MAWVLEDSVEDDGSEVGLGQWEINGNREWAVSKIMSVIKQLIL